MAILRGPIYLKLTAKLYIPIAQTPLRVVPGFCGGISIGVTPLAGKFRRNPTAAMVSADEQSYVPFVTTLITVGVFAFAVVMRGRYPPLALI